eukprot:101597-Chlamydomonas_euryale.AAC.4
MPVSSPRSTRSTWPNAALPGTGPSVASRPPRGTPPSPADAPLDASRPKAPPGPPLLPPPLPLRCTAPRSLALRAGRVCGSVAWCHWNGNGSVVVLRTDRLRVKPAPGTTSPYHMRSLSWPGAGGDPSMDMSSMSMLHATPETTKSARVRV